jgi:hypothetical protein
LRERSGGSAEYVRFPAFDIDLDKRRCLQITGDLIQRRRRNLNSSIPCPFESRDAAAIAARPGQGNRPRTIAEGSFNYPHVLTVVQIQVCPERGGVRRVWLACQDAALFTNAARGHGGEPADVRTDVYKDVAPLEQLRYQASLTRFEQAEVHRALSPVRELASQEPAISEASRFPAPGYRKPALLPEQKKRIADQRDGGQSVADAQSCSAAMTRSATASQS